MAMRSLLLVPSGDSAAVARGLASGADALVIDAGAAPRARAGGPAIFARARPLDAADALAEIEAAAAMGARGFAMPRAAGGGDVQRLGARLAVQEARLGLPDGTLQILAFASETPQAIFGLASYRGASRRLVGLVFTAAPLAASLRAAGPNRSPLRLARDLTLFAARAAGALALDAPFLDADDLDGLRAEAIAARDDGFDGKSAISPAQVAIINAVFR